MTLGEKFENFEVCHATGIESDIITCCHNFCLENVSEYQSGETHADVMYFTMNEERFSQEELTYFVHETLMYYMDKHSPIGCYFGNHMGDSTLGYWRILEYDQVGYEYEDCPTLPYKESGYPIFYQNDSIGDKIYKIGEFLENNYPKQYHYTDLCEVIADLTVVDSISPFETVKFCEKIIESVVTKILPLIAPNNMIWRLNDNTYGLYPELPAYTENTLDIERLIDNAPYIVKMFYITENKQLKQFPQLTGGLESLDALCHIISSLPHHVSFQDCIDHCEDHYLNNKPNIAEYINSQPMLLNWVIERVFWSDYKHQIDRLIGTQDITSLFHDILTYSNGEIDGITEDIYGLRETCHECVNNDDSYESDCSCDGLDELNNVWIISELSFFQELERQGAMVYETDSLYLYLQTDHAGNYYDRLLRKAWLAYGAMGWLGVLV